MPPTRAPHVHPAAPCHYMSGDAALPPDDGAVDTLAGWWARRDVVARGRVGGGWALAGARRRASQIVSGREGDSTGTHSPRYRAKFAHPNDE